MSKTEEYAVRRKRLEETGFALYKAAGEFEKPLSKVLEILDNFEKKVRNEVRVQLSQEVYRCRDAWSKDHQAASLVASIFADSLKLEKEK